jgi:hypothetical protein
MTAKKEKRRTMIDLHSYLSNLPPVSAPRLAKLLDAGLGQGERGGASALSEKEARSKARRGSALCGFRCPLFSRIRTFDGEKEAITLGRRAQPCRKR